jgi:hypothetical protein
MLCTSLKNWSEFSQVLKCSLTNDVKCAWFSKFRVKVHQIQGINIFLVWKIVLPNITGQVYIRDGWSLWTNLDNGFLSLRGIAWNLTQQITIKMPCFWYISNENRLKETRILKEWFNYTTYSLGFQWRDILGSFYSSEGQSSKEVVISLASEWQNVTKQPFY